jgi:hypothetical protein
MAERFSGSTQNKKDEVYAQTPKTQVTTNTVGPSDAQSCISEADPTQRGGITKFPMKPTPGSTA